MRPKDVERMANSDDPDQTATSGIVWSRSAWLVQICLSKISAQFDATYQSR